MILRSLIFVHRWLGVALCAVFLLWFPSGIGMMYWGFPGVSAEDRLDRSPKLDPAKIVLSPAEAAAKIGIQPNPTQVRLNSFDGRPVYRFTGGGGRGRGPEGGDAVGGRGRGGPRVIYADTGEEQAEVSSDMLDRIASAWTGRPLAEAKKESVEEVDQWTVAGQLRNLRPMYKYTWPNGEQVYLNGITGEVVQYTSFAIRLAAHVSAIPHWVYYTPLRKNQSIWLNFMIYASLIGTVGAIFGIVVAVWMYSPKKRYRLAGKPTGIPYRAQKRWHTIFGLVFGIATVTWTFSGLMSLGPFPIVQRLTQPAQPTQAAQQPQPTPETQSGEQGQVIQRGGGQQGVAGALRGRVRMADFASVHPRELLAKVPDLDVRELEFTSFAGTPLVSLNLGGGKSQLVSVNGEKIDGFDQQRITDIVKNAVPAPNLVETKLIDQYDLYYLDRTRQRPLPVILALVNDADKTRYYIDPKTARVVATYSNRNWVSRWLYNGLHSLNFPWLYNYRPLWDIVVIGFMVGGTGICVTSLVLAWTVLGRKLKRVKAASDVLIAET